MDRAVFELNLRKRLTGSNTSLSMYRERPKFRLIPVHGHGHFVGNIQPLRDTLRLEKNIPNRGSPTFQP
jgi:hypothetical protein